MNRCLYCYKELTDGEIDFNSRCAKKIFGSAEIPLLPYAKDEIETLAEKVVRSQTTLTGVQAKLSLDIEKTKGEPQRFTIVGLWGRYILKPQTEQFKHLPEVEDLTMHLAEVAKIEVVPHSLSRWRISLYHQANRPNFNWRKAGNGRYVSVVGTLDRV